MARRLVTVPVLFLVWGTVLAVSLPAALVASGFDRARRAPGSPTVRLVAFALAYLTFEVLGVIAAAALWVARPWRPQRWADRNHRLQQWWTARLVHAAGPVLGLRLTVEETGAPGTVPLDEPGAVVVVSRHVSIVDALLPDYVLGVQRGRRLRYVLARGLRLDPCLDIVGHRLPNHFVARGEDAAREVAALEAMAAGMGPEDAAVIFPEGGLYSSARRERAIRSLVEKESPRLPVARSLRHLLAPRPAGTLALLRAAPGADVVVLGHHGIEPLASPGALWRNVPLAAPVRLRVERHERAGLPTDDEGLTRWLDDRWAEVDEWLDQQARRDEHRGAEAAG